MARYRPLFGAALVWALPALALAWTPYGPPPFGPAYPGGPGYPGSPGYPYGPGYPGAANAMPEQPAGKAEPAGTEQPGAGQVGEDPAPAQAPGDTWGDPWGRAGSPYGGFPTDPWGEMPPMGPPPGFGEPPPWSSPRSAPWSAPGSTGMRGRQGVSVETTDDAYLISIDTAGASPEGVQVSPAGRGLSISRSTDEQTVQEDSFDDGRGYRRSFSFSRGSSSRRIPLPPDADVTKMTRENAEDAVRLRIPRLSGQGSDWDQGSPWGPSGRSGGASGAPGYPNQ